MSGIRHFCHRFWKKLFILLIKILTIYFSLINLILKYLKITFFFHRSVIFLNRIESVLQKGYIQFQVLQKKMLKFPKYLTRFMYENWPWFPKTAFWLGDRECFAHMYIELLESWLCSNHIKLRFHSSIFFKLALNP